MTRKVRREPLLAQSMSTGLASFVLLFARLAVGCGEAADSSGDTGGGPRSTQEAGAAMPVESDGRAPFPAPEWEVRAPEQQGLRKAGLDAALDYAFQAEKHTQGVVIVRGRAVVAERRGSRNRQLTGLEPRFSLRPRVRHGETSAPHSTKGCADHVSTYASDSDDCRLHLDVLGLV
jgi:hypothetical protein